MAAATTTTTTAASKRLSHAERRQRRRKMAGAVGNGASLPAACRRFGVTIQTVRQACHEFGVALNGASTKPRPTKRKAAK